MKIIKKTISLIAIGALILSLIGCKNESIETNGAIEDNKNELLNSKNETSNFITEDEIWNEAQNIANVVLENTGEKTILGVKSILEYVETSEDVKKASDEMLFNLLQKVKKSYDSRDTLDNKYTYLYIVACVHNRISDEFKKVYIDKTLNLEEDETLLIEVEGLQEAVADVYGSMISDLRKLDRTKH